MLRSIISMVMPLVAGQGIKSTIKGLARRAAALIAAAILLVAALAFGLVALYALLRGHGFEVAEAAGIMTGGLVALAALVLAIAMLGKKRHTRGASQSPFSSAIGGAPATGATGVVDQQVEHLMRQVGPFSLLAAAFAIGLTAGRK